MRCDCCDKRLSNSEATARFVNDTPDQPARYVNMCSTCRGFLPPEVKITTRNNFTEDDGDESEDSTINVFDHEDDYGYEE